MKLPFIDKRRLIIKGQILKNDSDNLQSKQKLDKVQNSHCLLIVLFQDLVDNAMEEYPELRLFAVEEAICKSGNKQFPLPLSDFSGDG